MHSQTVTCPCCRQPGSQLYCQACIQEGVSTHRDVSGQVSRQVDSSTSRAAQYLEGSTSSRTLQAWRRLRADLAKQRRSCERARMRIAYAEAELQKSRTETSRPTIPSRPATIPVAVTEALISIERKQADVARRLVDARRVLVRECVHVFGVRVGPRQVWEIAGMPIPSSPELFRMSRPVRINAALAHTIHLLTLVTRYLGIALPFGPFQPVPHIGRPKMMANSPFVSTTRFHDEPILWMSSTARADTADKPKSQIKQRRFLTAFGLLAHSIGYLAHSQGVLGVGVPDDAQPDVPLPVWSILQLLDALAQSPQLGTFSHDPGGPRSSPHLLYGLDVAKVVGTVVRAEERKWGIHKLDASDLSDGWDLMESADEG